MSTVDQRIDEQVGMGIEHTVSFSPVTGKVYMGNLANEDMKYEKYFEPVAKINFNKSIADGKVEPIAYERFRRAERQRRAIASGGVGDTTDITNIQQTLLLTEIIGKQWRDFYAINGTTKVPVPKLVLKVPTMRHLAADKKVPELVEANAKTSTYSQVNFSLWKNVTEIMWSDESIFKANINPLTTDIDTAAGALGKAANDQIVSAIEGFYPGLSKGSWSAMIATYGNFSNRNPLADISATIDAIISATNQYRPDIITIPSSIFGTYASNTFVNGYAPAVDRSQPIGMIPLPKYPGITAIVDPQFTNSRVSLYDKRTFLLGDGPTVSEQYRNPRAGAYGYIIRQFLQPLGGDTAGGNILNSIN